MVTNASATPGTAGYSTDTNTPPATNSGDTTAATTGFSGVLANETSGNTAAASTAASAGTAGTSATNSVIPAISLTAPITGDLGQPDASIDNLSFPEQIGGSPSTTKGEFKGEKNPDVAAIINATQNLLQLAAKNQKGYADSGGPGILGQLNDLFNPGAGGVPNDTAQAAQQGTDRQTAIKDYQTIVAESRKLGVILPGNLESATGATVFVKTKQLLAVGLPTQVLSSLKRQGFDTANVNSLGSLVHDQALKRQANQGSPGVTQVEPATGQQNVSVSGAEMWDSFTNDWANGTGKVSALAYQKNLVQEMQSMGLLPIGATPTAEQVGKAYESIIQGASAAKQTPAQYIAQAVPDATQNPYYAETAHILQEIGINPNSNPTEVQALANAYSAQGGSSIAADLVWSQAINNYNPADASNTTGGGLINQAETAINDTYGQWGMPAPTGEALGNMVKQVLAAVSSGAPYQTTDFAQTIAEKNAKAAMSAQYPSLAPSIAEGISPVQTAQNYWDLAKTLTGTVYNATTPGAFAWAGGGSNGGQMSLPEYESSIKQSPAFQNSPAGKAAYSDAAYAIGQLFGKEPGGAQNPASDFSGINMAPGLTT